MAPPLGGAAGGPDSGNHLVNEDVNGGAPRECCRRVRQWPPLQLEVLEQKTSVAGPWEAVLKPKSTHHLMLKTPMMAPDPSGGIPIPSVVQTCIGSYKGSHR
jgi:hypothetical protein